MKRSVLSANPLGLTASIVEQIENLQKELTSVFGKTPTLLTAPAGWKKKRPLSVAAVKKLPEFQKASWAKTKAAQWK